MYKIGKTDTSFESPNFFHINQVPMIQHKKSYSNKLLLPELKLGCSMDNPLTNISRTRNEIKPKEKFRYEDIVFASAKKNSGRSEIPSVEMREPVSFTRVFNNDNSPYSICHHDMLKSKGFNKNKGMFSSQFEIPKLTRNYSEKLSVLKNKIKSINRQEEKALSHIPSYFITEKKLKSHLHDDIFAKSSKRNILLSTEIREFEKKLYKFNK